MTKGKNKEIESENLEDLINDFVGSESKQIVEEEDLVTEAFEVVAKDKIDTSSLDNYDNHQEQALVLSEKERKILEYTLKGMTPETTAVSLGLPKAFVRGFLLKKDVKGYLRELKEAKSQLMQLRALDIYGEIIDARIDKMQEEGEGYESLSKKDTVDILRAAIELSNGIDKSRAGEAEGDIYVNILNQVKK